MKMYKILISLLSAFLRVATAAAVASVMSDSVRPHRRQPTRLPCPWDSPGKNTGVGCHCLLQCRKVKSESEVVQSCPTLSNPMDCSPPGSSVHGSYSKFNQHFVTQYELSHVQAEPAQRYYSKRRMNLPNEITAGKVLTQSQN